jgi:hypothetical protein
VGVLLRVRRKIDMSIDTDSVFDAIGTGWMLGDCSGIESVMTPDVKYHMPPIGDVDPGRAGGFHHRVPPGIP